MEREHIQLNDHRAFHSGFPLNQTRLNVMDIPFFFLFHQRLLGNSKRNNIENYSQISYM